MVTLILNADILINSQIIVRSSGERRARHKIRRSRSIDRSIGQSVKGALGESWRAVLTTSVAARSRPFPLIQVTTIPLKPLQLFIDRPILSVAKEANNRKRSGIASIKLTASRVIVQLPMRTCYFPSSPFVRPPYSRIMRRIVLSRCQLFPRVLSILIQRNSLMRFLHSPPRGHAF